ncbi:hypothetical protein BDB01DRAFT_776990 [Pilobolus umbonatus]|nr:hypothetical protein BDB01DRAFT_776990 [Pilobolus umbonatus]
MNESSEQQEQLATDNKILHKRLQSIQQTNDEFIRDHDRLQANLFQQEQELSRLVKEAQGLKKTKEDIERKLAKEAEEYEKDRIEWQNEEINYKEKLLTIQNASRSNKRENDESFPFSYSNEVETADNQAVISSTQPNENLSTRTIRVQEKMICDLKNEISDHSIQITNNLNNNALQLNKIDELQYELENIRQLNTQLMEENEGYQLLLHEKTLNGSHIMGLDSLLLSNSNNSNTVDHLNLANELTKADNPLDNSRGYINKLNEEIRQLQDTNKALNLYMNKILMRIVNNRQLEAVLSIDYPKEPKNKKIERPSQVVYRHIDKYTVDRNTKSDNAITHHTRIPSPKGRKTIPSGPGPKETWSTTLKRMSGLHWS